MRDYSFKPGWAPSIAMAALVPVFLALGQWQLRRAAEKEALLAVRAERGRSAELRIDCDRDVLDDVRFRPIVATGTYDTAHQFLLDNQVYQGQAGYHVLTPLQLDGTPRCAVLVNRGWVGAGPDRNRLPSLVAAEVPISVRGIADRFPGVAWRIPGAEIPAAGWPAVVQIAEPAALSERLGYSILPYQVLLSPTAPQAYVRDWKPATVDPGKNRGYALQWFSFAAVLVALFVWHGVSRSTTTTGDAKHDR